MTRLVMLEQLRQDYVLTARIKGASEFRVVISHALRNASIPLVTIVALSYGGLPEGSVLIETVFAWPGIGNYITSSLFSADMNAVLGGTILVGSIFVFLNLLSDVLYRALDPRSHQGAAMTDTVDIRHSSSKMRSAKLAELRRFWRRFLRNRLGVLGRDIYSRIIYGSRLTLLIVALVVITSAPLGLLIGTVAGTCGGWTDRIFMRITDVFLAVPKLLLALAFVAALGPGIINAALAITLTAWPPYARLARAESLIVRNADYVSAMRLAGASEPRIVLRHIAPMCLSSVIVRMTFDMAGIILTVAGLGFIGLGAQPPMPEWGAMISTGRKFIFDQWWVATMPGFAIFIVILGFYLLGDAMRDLLHPHLRIRGGPNHLS